MMQSKNESFKNDLNTDGNDDTVNIKKELSLAEQVFAIPYFLSEEGLKPSFFKSKDLSNLSVTSRTSYSFAKQELNQRAAQKLLTHVVLGEQTKAQDMIKANPKLLLIKSQAEDYSGRIIIATPFQAAIGAGDKPMWEMMLPYFEGLEQGKALEQFQEQFPNGIKDDTPASELQASYNAIASAIINDEDNGLSAIEQFRKDITAQKEIKQGKHFNLQHLLAAYQAYIDNFDALGNWNNALGNWDNCDLFWEKVVGYVQRQMTAYDAQIHCSGVQSVLNNKNSFSRSLEFSWKLKFFPLEIDSGLGFDFGYYGRRPTSGARGLAGRAAELLKNYVEQKTEALGGLRESLEQGLYYQPN